MVRTAGGARLAATPSVQSEHALQARRPIRNLEHGQSFLRGKFTHGSESVVVSSTVADEVRTGISNRCAYAVVVTAPLPLVERKRRRARQRILNAADELFLAHGFDKVSVSEIAERAEVGRTTFFRYFGDKQEVVFAKQQALLDTIAAARDGDAPAVAQTATEAVEQLRPVVLDLCAQVTADPEGYARHCELLDQHQELRARDALKMQQIADTLNDLLTHRGCDEAIARLAAEIALACYQTPRHLGNDPETLVDETRAAFEHVLTLGTDPV
jgi:AcrR family transcriptional regulator